MTGTGTGTHFGVFFVFSCGHIYSEFSCVKSSHFNKNPRDQELCARPKGLLTHISQQKAAWLLLTTDNETVFASEFFLCDHTVKVNMKIVHLSRSWS